MEFLPSIILGAIEGLTEFLPVSSSGHLIIGRELLGLNTPTGLAYDAVLQLAAAGAVLVYFWKDIIRLTISGFKILADISGSKGLVERADRIMVYAIILGTIPAIVFGLLLERYMETVFRSAYLVAWMLIVGSILFIVAERYARQNKNLTVGKGIAIGFFQILALVPGVSRSGATISGGLLAGLTRESAARFSFLLSFPIIVGSGLKQLLNLSHSDGFTDWWNLALSATVAFVLGLTSIYFLMRYLKHHSLYVFAGYRILLGVVIIAVYWLR